MMVMYFPWAVKHKGATYATAVHNVDDMKLLEDGYCLVTLDSGHCRHSVMMLTDRSGVECVPEPPRTRYSFRVHGKPTSPGQTKKLSKIANISKGLWDAKRYLEI